MDKFLLRMPDGMRDRIAEAAKASGRSMNSEIVCRLQESFEPPAPLDEGVLRRFFRGIVQEEIQRALDRQLQERGPDALPKQGALPPRPAKPTADEAPK